jgi:hypothetical protein
LGTTVTCDSGGFPTSDGNSKVEIYTGATPYKVTLKNSGGTTIWSLDNVVGALDTSAFLTDDDIEPTFPITNSSSNQALEADDNGNFYNLNCSGGDITVTLDNAADLGDGWNAVIRHDGTANQILITGTSSELFKIASHTGVTAFAIALRGQTYKITCDGTGFKVEQTAPALHNTVGVITVADRLSVPPSAEAGARYLVGTGPSGAWSTFAQHDIAEYSGSGWFKITPPTNSGWVAWVDDEKRHYNHDSTNGWRLLVNGQAGLEYVTSGTISAASSLTVSIPTDADEVELILLNIIPATDAVVPTMRFTQSGTPVSGAADYQWGYAFHTVSTNNSTQDISDSEIELSGNIGSTTNERFHVSIRVFKPNAASTIKAVLWDGGGRHSDANVYKVNGVGELIGNTNAIDGVQIYMSSGNITSGLYILMARRYS